MIIESTISAVITEQIAKLIAKPGIDAIGTKLHGLRKEKDNVKLRTEYENVIYGLLNDRQEALAIVSHLKTELESIKISNDDIESLHKTISKALSIIASMGVDPNSIESMETLKDLIYSDMLKVLQLVGFSYKEAIGEPLTEIVQNYIRGTSQQKLSNTSPQRNQLNRKK